MSASTQELATERQTGPRERVARLRERIVHAPREACIERARYYTESFKRTEGEPQIVRMAKALRHHLENMTVVLNEKEASSMLKLMDLLEDLDDVQNVYANFDIPEEVMNRTMVRPR